ncbi:MAG: UDP-3-O-(3-hydroxymyristoyl)glucosamine N-acyltransferase [Acidobacteria bacterium]|nr:UDP-3-O-(3-hydroxymyristoyl)glucosamine N-acyltransferase [Acidobacteriota bacterium]
MAESRIEFRAEELAERLGGELRNCDPGKLLRGVRPLEEALADSVSFLANPKYGAKALASGAGLILADPRSDLGGQPVLVVANPYWAFARAVGLFHPEPEPAWGEAPVHPSARLGEGTRLGPGVTIGARTVLGARCVLHPGVHVGDDCVLGDGCELFSGVVLYRRTRLGRGVRIHANSVLGSDGYGYVLVDGRHEKVPQAGWVELGDDVELGACVTVDRGVLGPTRIGAGTKVDNQVQVAHNVQVGEHCLLVSQVGISGSVKIGDYVTLAGKVGVAGHLEIGARSIVSGNSVVAKSLPEGSFVAGIPARPHREWAEAQAALNRLPRWIRAQRKSGKD